MAALTPQQIAKAFSMNGGLVPSAGFNSTGLYSGILPSNIPNGSYQPLKDQARLPSGFPWQAGSETALAGIEGVSPSSPLPPQMPSLPAPVMAYSPPAQSSPAPRMPLMAGMVPGATGIPRATSNNVTASMTPNANAGRSWQFGDGLMALLGQLTNKQQPSQGGLLGMLTGNRSQQPSAPRQTVSSNPAREAALSRPGGYREQASSTKSMSGAKSAKRK